ncbi:hypothetical protein FF1_028480 [Malus domestica]
MNSTVFYIYIEVFLVATFLYSISTKLLAVRRHEAVERKLKELDIKYMKKAVEDDENGTKIDQLFFNVPDGFMVEMCNCENLKLVPAGSLGKIKLPVDRHTPPVELNQNGNDNDDDAKELTSYAC